MRKAKNNTGIFQRFRAVFLVVVSIAGTAAPAQRIGRIDIFDKADNNLMFVTFDYDANGKNIGRSVFMSDSTFVRSDVFANDAQGNRTKETSIDFNGLPVFATTFSTDASRRSMSVVDQFNLDQLGGPVSFGATGLNNYEIYQNGAVINKMLYTYDAQSSLIRIDVLDPAGGLLYYILPKPPTGAIIPNHARSPATPILYPKGQQRYIIRFTVTEPSEVTAQLFSLTGKRAKMLVQGKQLAGTHDILVDLASDRIGYGVFILRVSIEGAPVLSKKILVQTGGQGGAR